MIRLIGASTAMSQRCHVLFARIEHVKRYDVGIKLSVEDYIGSNYLTDT